MKLSVIGLRRSKGIFTNSDTGVSYDFDNVIFHGYKLGLSPDFIGDEVFIVKAPFKCCSNPLDDYVNSVVSFDIDSRERGSNVCKASEVEIVSQVELF